MIRSLLFVHQNCTSNSQFIKQAKKHLKIGLLITFHYHTVLCNCQKANTPSTNSLTSMAENITNSSVFTGKEDRYKGIHVKSKNNICSTSNFITKLEASLQEWTSQKKSAAWFYISLGQSEWVPLLTKNGFRFHHAARDGSEVAMVRWLAAGESHIPVFSHTMIGVGAVVVNTENKLLVVQERYQNQPYWKLPGGYVEPGEDIPAAAMREVLEETNIKTEFKSMVAFRHSHGGPFGCSDIYFIVELAPLTAEITSCEIEIEDSQWMEMDTYLKHPKVHENNRLFLRKYLFSKENGIVINGTKTNHPITKAPQTLYCLEHSE
ncbi:nudix hydrolase 2-like isoform X2 [Homalodisca vitripennis]|uniref:nudix hydrolase 2-like isoform X1 n=1 Tax=Homalodisca vitripennis TaxID=197043 RepID=UPI001EEA5F6E|nr:nudix hydrolase 2-like isoform X1 [Homalodisca vitripennis]XP_046660694.1 nudix hydrolase 2-like isoform X2 [Homalodisca vitripennis]